MKKGLTKVEKERLTKLANHLKTVPQKLFDLDYIVDVRFDDLDADDLQKERENKLKKMAKQELNCGTTACAIGWCPVVFPRSFAWQDANTVVLKEKSKFGYTLNDFDAAERFFGLNHNQAEYLFMPRSYHKSKRGPKSVAARIEALVKNNGLMTQKNYGYEE